ncbi:MAG TPA: WbqC family protein [Euzebyales bacterium]|nr:WbqC family protein [Euzebyales bacterium]
MRVAVYQPQYLPRLHYVNRALDADVFVVLDSAQFTRKLKHHAPADGGGTDSATVHPSYQAHTPIRLASGRHLLTVPIRHGGSRTSIARAEVADPEQWVATHLRSLHSGYANAPQYPARAPELADLLEGPHDGLADLNLRSLLWALTTLLELHVPVGELTLASVNAGLATQNHVRLRRVVVASRMAAERPTGRQQGNAWIAALCAELGATEYLCGGTAAGNYMDKEFFVSRGVEPVLQSWHCGAYPQQFSDRHAFLSNLSIVDLLLNVDAATARAVVRPA